MIAIPLDGFLLTPVQKICKYQLQLRELLCCTWRAHPDFTALTTAADAMRDMTALVNERKRKMESVEKLVEWQRSVAQWQVIINLRPLVTSNSKEVDLCVGGVYGRSSPVSLCSLLLVPWTRTSAAQRSFAAYGSAPGPGTDYQRPSDH